MALRRKKNKEQTEDNQKVNTPRKHTPVEDNEDFESRSSETSVKSGANRLSDPRFRKMAGLLLLAFAVFLLISQISFYFNWEADQSALENLPDQPRTIGNRMGWLGALISNLLIFKGFGFSAILLIPIIFRYSLRILLPGRRNLPGPSNTHLIFHLFWWSVAFGFFFPEWMDGIAGGRIGMRLATKIELYTGNFGTPLVLAISMLSYLVLAFNIRLIPQFLENRTVSDQKANTKPEEGSASIPSVNIYTHRDEFETEAAENQEKQLESEEIWDYNTPVEAADESEVQIFDLTETTEDAVAVPITPPVTLPIPEAPPAEEMEVSTGGEITMEIEILEEELAATPASESGMPDIRKVAADLAAGLVEKYGPYNPLDELPGYRFPSVDLLADLGGTELKVDPKELEANKNRIVETLRHYGVEIQKIKATIGPTVTLYEIVPAPGVRISRIKNLEDDIALSLAAHGIRIIAPIPGKGTIGIEVPNQNPAVVGMKSIFLSEKWQQNKFDLPVALGRTISNEVFLADLAKMPHLLVAGATGQGKSVGINTLLVSLLYSKHPSELKFVMIDPKKVELTLYSLIEKHYLAKLPGEEEPIITDTKKVINTLNSLCIEMDNRYELLKNAQVRNLKEYNERFRQRRLNPNEGHRFLPYIVLVIDEFADLIMTAGKEVELPIARLAQLARAIGIHLIIATQRPSVNIITGTIKANFPARLAFRVSSKVDSRTILDAGGAEQLIGRGDMLLSIGSDLIRLQCPFVDTPEVERIVAFISEQRGFPEALMLPEYVGEDGDPDKTKFDSSSLDDLFDEAARIIVQHQQGSASLLQRRLNIGYNRAGRLIDQMEAAGIVGPNKGSKAREVLVHDEISLQNLLDSLR